jgi:chemotaxis protein CheD
MAELICNEFTYLLPGELIVTSEPMKISTVLGSCVAVCMYDRELKVGGMNHYMMPFYKKEDDILLKYGDTSLNQLLNKMMQAGARKNRIVVRIYGGASVLRIENSTINVAEKNIGVAYDFVKKHNLVVNSVEVGGHKGRKVIFDTLAGVISCSFLREIRSATNWNSINLHGKYLKKSSS